MEREVMLTGIGGQGVQLAAQVLARAAAAEGRSVSLFGVYGGMMRGGNSDSAVVVADGPVQAPPLLSHAWSAIVMHHKFWEPMAPKIRTGGFVVVNSSLFEGHLERDRYGVVEISATELATDLGAPMAASMVMVGAFLQVTGLVGLDSAIQAMADSLPAYRSQHVAINKRALRSGVGAAEGQSVPAWDGAAV